MMKKTGLAVIIICLFLLIVSPGLVVADSGLTVLNSDVAADFPATLDFSLSARSDADITDIRLHYKVDRMGFARVISEVYIDHTPAATVEAEWNWDMRKTGGLPPGSSVEYWWTVEDAGGGQIKTEPARVRFDDNRYEWQGLTRGMVTVYWYKGDDSFAGKIMDAVEQALGRLAENTGAELDSPVKLYVYGSSQDLRGSMIFPQEWTGGVAFTRYGTIAIGISPGNLDWGSRAIAHELTHLVVHQVTINPYGDLPSWLDEGLAMYAEGGLESEFVKLLKNAREKNGLISVRSLASPFSAFAEESLLAYAESHSLVEYLINNYGQAKMFDLLNTFRQGSSYDDALLSVYGFDMDGLDALWRK